MTRPPATPSASVFDLVAGRFPGPFRAGLTEPGFTSWPRWRPDANTGRLTDRAGWGGVARIS